MDLTNAQQEAWDKLGQRYEEVGFGGLSEPEQYFVALEALAGSLWSAEERGGAIKLKRERVDVIEEETEYFEGAPAGRAFPMVDRLLAGLIVGRAGGASQPVRRS